MLSYLEKVRRATPSPIGQPPSWAVYFWYIFYVSLCVSPKHTTIKTPSDHQDILYSIIAHSLKTIPASNSSINMMHVI